MRAGQGAQCGVLARNVKACRLSSPSCLASPLGTVGEKAQGQQHRFWAQVRRQQQALLLIILGERPFYPSPSSHWSRASTPSKWQFLIGCHCLHHQSLGHQEGFSLSLMRKLPLWLGDKAGTCCLLTSEDWATTLQRVESSMLSAKGIKKQRITQMGNRQCAEAWAAVKNQIGRHRMSLSRYPLCFCSGPLLGRWLFR